MPKSKLPDRVWKERLQLYSRGQHKFGRGEKPRKGSKWYTEIQKIDACPITQAPASGEGSSRGSKRDVFGNVMTCTCGYHVSAVHTRVVCLPVFGRHVI